jgi:hypothetical protein
LIVSASRRTDIPAFYGQWLAALLRAGEAWVLNPYNRKLVRVDLRPEAVDGIVLWTKNIAPFLPPPSELEPYPYYVQFTLNPYGPPFEPGLPDLERRIGAFRELSRRLGRFRVVWRYDPVVLSPRTPVQYHLEQFGRLAGALCGYTDKCIISFMAPSATISRRTAPHGIREADGGEARAVARGFANIAARIPYRWKAVANRRFRPIAVCSPAGAWTRSCWAGSPGGRSARPKTPASVRVVDAPGAWTSARMIPAAMGACTAMPTRVRRECGGIWKATIPRVRRWPDASIGRPARRRSGTRRTGSGMNGPDDGLIFQDRNGETVGREFLSILLT